MALDLGEAQILRAVADDSKRFQEARLALNRFFECEEKQEYDRCYEMLSSAYKASLSQSGIRNKREYKKMRVSQGVRWHSPRIKDQNTDRQLNVFFSVEVSSEKTVPGKPTLTENREMLVVVIHENGRWVIDSWGADGD